MKEIRGFGNSIPPNFTGMNTGLPKALVPHSGVPLLIRSFDFNSPAVNSEATGLASLPCGLAGNGSPLKPYTLFNMSFTFGILVCA
jgi:hypothetical protein